jgi:hypothetical protein
MVIQCLPYTEYLIKLLFFFSFLPTHIDFPYRFTFLQYFKEDEFYFSCQSLQIHGTWVNHKVPKSRYCVCLTYLYISEFRIIF